MTHDEVQKWLDGYIAAWASNDADAIGDLFTQDAVYSYRPWISDAATITGREAIVASWLKGGDDPGDWDAEYQPYVVEGDRAVALGWSRYRAKGDEPEKTYHNAYILRFEEGRCAEFREFYFLEGK